MKEVWLVVYSADGHEYGWPTIAFATEKEAKDYALAHPYTKTLGNSYTASVESILFGEGKK